MRWLFYLQWGAISKCLEKMNITKKRGSSEGYQTQNPDVQFCVWGFQNCPPPFGIYVVPHRKLIDFDEFGVTFEKCTAQGGGLWRWCASERMGIIITTRRWLSSLLLSREIRTCCHMLKGVLNVLNAGSNVYVRLVPPLIFFVIIVIIFARILRWKISQALTLTRFSFGTILLHITASMFTILWQPVLVPAILQFSCGLHPIQSTALLSTRSAR